MCGVRELESAQIHYTTIAWTKNQLRTGYKLEGSPGSSQAIYLRKMCSIQPTVGVDSLSNPYTMTIEQTG